MGSGNDAAAVDANRLSGDITAAFGNEPGAGFGDIIGNADPADGNGALEGIGIDLVARPATDV